MEGTGTVLSRVQKHIEALNAKNAKLAEENARLKKQLSDLKASQSRIRRIPKATASADAPAETEATA